MVKRLYGEASVDEAHNGSTEPDPEKTKEKMRDRMSAREEFKIGFCSYLFYYTLTKLCCCFVCCLRKCAGSRSYIDKHRKFEIAMERLS